MPTYGNNVPVPLSAKTSKAVINGFPLYGAMKWNAVPETAYLDTSNFYAQGFEDQIGGLRKLDIHIEGWFDSANSPYDTPLNLQDGQVITFTLFTDDINSPCWFGTALLKGQPMTADVHGRVDFSMDMKAKASFNSPTATTTTTTTTT
jgi:hypothetical protein